VWDRRGDEERKMLEITGTLWTAVPQARVPRGVEVKSARERGKKGRKEHTEINDAILDEKGCLNTSESLLDNRAQWYKRAVSRECRNTCRSCAGRTGKL